MGAICRELRPRYRHDDFWSLRAAEGAAEEVRLRARSDRHRGQAAARQEVTDGVEKGGSSPLGATPMLGGVNFSVFSRHGTGVELLLLGGVGDSSRAGARS